MRGGAKVAVESLITIFVPGYPPGTFNLDQFGRDYVLMGRGATHGNSRVYNDIRLDESIQFVSRAHCVFKRDAHGRWSVEDDHSANGLVFHDRRVDIHYLSDGDKVYIGPNARERVVMLYSRRSEPMRQPQSQMSGMYETTLLEKEEGVTSVLSTVSASAVQNYPLRSMRQCVIGRAPNCNIVLDHPSVSRQHCIIAQQNGQYYIYDNNSTNGVILNAKLLQRSAPLNQMDRISIAGFSFIFCDECLYAYEPSGGVGVSISRLYKEVGKGAKKKYICNNVNLTLEPNKFIAIVGGSGAGKTTLLNCMAGITDFTYGEVLVNGESIRTSGKSLRSLMGYVPQQDIVYDSLTLERMLLYSAKLRMPQDTSSIEIQRKINETLQLVELSEHRGTLISKLSGGERKRASIAVELLASPRLFFLDEPSSGLDPGTEKHLMQMLKRLSKTGKTVIMVTHTVQNLDLCDTVVCMGKGGVLCYAGTPSDALKFFNKSRYTDIYDDLNENSMAAATRFLQASQGMQQGTRTEQVPIERRLTAFKSPLASLREFWAMMCRYVEIMANDLPRLILLLAMPVLLTALVCVAFQADGNFYNLMRRTLGSVAAVVRKNFPFLVATDTMSLLFAFSCACFWTGIFNSIQEISKERPIFERERFAGVGIFPYVMSKFVPLFVLCLIQSASMCGVLNFMTSTTATVNGVTTSATALPYGIGTDGVVLGAGLMWLENFITTFLCVLSAMSLGLLISTLVSNEMALVLCPMCLMPQILFSGVVGALTGITKVISEFITCKWACLAFFVSADINQMYKSCEYKAGTWELTTFSDDDGMGIMDAAYESATHYVLGLNGVLSAWLVMGLMSVVCLIGAALILRFKRGGMR